MTTIEELQSTADMLANHLSPTPQISWPLLSKRTGAETWVKHENHLPTGAFKIRGGLVYMDWLRRERPECPGVISATRGNHGQSIALAAREFGFAATIVVPHGNSLGKNAAMRAYGAELIEHGEDFQEALEFTRTLAEERQLTMVESFHPLLVRGVSTCGFELLANVKDLDAVYVPIGLGSGICGMMTAREALGLKTRVIGVVAENAPAYALSFEQRKPVATESSKTFADGVACRTPAPAAVEQILAGVERVVRVSESEIAAAIRHYYTDTHNLAEGAGAAGLAALLRERERMAGKKVGLVLTGGNIDESVYAKILAGEDPS